MSIYDIDLITLEGEQTSLDDHRGKALLVVNVASRCGFTPQYQGLQELHDRLSPSGFAVLGFPCNQFLEQEPGDADEIRSFCERRFGVTFPLFAKCDVNGDDEHPLFAVLKGAPDADGEAGDVKWNFEKFLVSPDGEPVQRFRTQIEPSDEALVAAVEQQMTKVTL